VDARERRPQIRSGAATRPGRPLASFDVPPPRKQLPSLDLVLDVLRHGRDERRAHFEALDQKAGLALGFAGVLITLSRGIGEPWRTAGVLLAMVSGATALGAFWPRQLPMLDSAREYVHAPLTQTRLALLDATITMNVQADRALARKAGRLKTALSAMALAVLVLGTGAMATPRGGTDGRGGGRGSVRAVPAAPADARGLASHQRDGEAAGAPVVVAVVAEEASERPAGGSVGEHARGP
jgi:hypothetical protein